jgi:EAL domain-containing protein (putative c-di-GMP-specific phosphodiesterase class I)
VFNFGVSLGLRVIAEGVENEDHLARLQDLKCGWAQGFYFSVAVPPADMRALLAAGEMTPGGTPAPLVTAGASALG